MVSEVVAAKIGTHITNSRAEIILAIELKLPIEFLDRRRMRLMAAFDLGAQWKSLAESPTLFRIGDNDEVLAP